MDLTLAEFIDRYDQGLCRGVGTDARNTRFYIVTESLAERVRGRGRAFAIPIARRYCWSCRLHSSSPRLPVVFSTLPVIVHSDCPADGICVVLTPTSSPSTYGAQSPVPSRCAREILAWTAAKGTNSFCTRRCKLPSFNRQENVTGRHRTK